MNLGTPNNPTQLVGGNLQQALDTMGQRWLVVPPWFADLIFMPDRRCNMGKHRLRRPKKALYKRLLAASRREQKRRGLR